MKNKGRTRREFLKNATASVVAGAFCLSAPSRLFAQNAHKTKVVLVRNKEVLDSLNKPRQNVVQEMLDSGVTTLLGEKDPVKAWKKIVTFADVVGIKSNEWSSLPTPPEVESAIRKRLLYSAHSTEKGV